MRIMAWEQHILSSHASARHQFSNLLHITSTAVQPMNQQHADTGTFSFLFWTM
jgi:hypothetical protein